MFAFLFFLPPDTLLAFGGAALVIALAPGPDNIFVLTQSALYGVKAGIAATLGLLTGIIWHSFIVAMGVAALVQASPLAYTVLQCVGAGYLVYLAYLTWKSGSVRADVQKSSCPGMGSLYRRGIVMNATNPKVTLFFLAFLPQFMQPARGNLPWQTAQLGIIFALATFVVFGSVALAGGRLSVWLNSTPQGQMWLNKIAAVVFVLLAASLLFSS